METDFDKNVSIIKKSNQSISNEVKRLKDQIACLVKDKEKLDNVLETLDKINEDENLNKEISDRALQNEKNHLMKLVNINRYCDSRYKIEERVRKYDSQFLKYLIGYIENYATLDAYYDNWFSFGLTVLFFGLSIMISSVLTVSKNGVFTLFKYGFGITIIGVVCMLASTRFKDNKKAKFVLNILRDFQQ